jgi:chromodomain-helicase-DNA-binding protein 4
MTTVKERSHPLDVLDVVVQVDPLSDVEKFLDCQMRPSTVSSAATGGGAEDASDPNPTPKDLVKHYLIKWKSMSYLHCSW